LNFPINILTAQAMGIDPHAFLLTRITEGDFVHAQK
jgi:hypothetical protein